MMLRILIVPAPQDATAGTHFHDKECCMLVLTRKVKQKVLIGDGIEVEILRIKGNRVAVGVRAPDSVKVYRGEVQKRIDAEREVPVGE